MYQWENKIVKELLSFTLWIYYIIQKHFAKWFEFLKKKKIALLFILSEQVYITYVLSKNIYFYNLFLEMKCCLEIIDS